MTEIYNAAAGHGQDWGMETQAKVKDESILDLSSAADHGRIVHHATRKIVRGVIEYQNHSITIYANPNARRHAYLIKADDWN